MEVGRDQPRGIRRWAPALTLLGTASVWASGFTQSDDAPVPDDAIHAGVPSASDSVDFNRDVRPILVARCFVCHGPDESTRKRGLRLDLRDGAIAPAKPGRDPAIVPGDAERSLLIERITDHLDPMPPSGEPLTAAEIETLRRWIDGGAEYAGHWSWEPVGDPTPPSIAPERQRLIRTDIDRFILAALEEVDLHPSDDATPARQVRRLSYDLVGLPPDPTIVAAFEADPSEAHWERLVEMYLASPGFGERWGRHWLDLVRYAETCGHEFDYPIREAWRYRDWVIRAFNDDLPYDRFIREQIAGDLLEPRINPTDETNESVVGTGFWYFHQAVHAPTDVTQDQSDRIANQLEVLGQGFLGLTVACARCHDHKFDAISTRDYYALSGYVQSMHQGYAYQDPGGVIRAAVARLAEQEPASAATPKVEAGSIAAYLEAAADARELEGSSSIAIKRGLDPELLARWIMVFNQEDWQTPEHPWHAWISLGHRQGIESEDVRTPLLDTLDQGIDESAQVLESFDQSKLDLRWYATGWAWNDRNGPSGDGGLQPTASGTMASDTLEPRLQGTLRSETFTLDHRFLHWRVRGTGEGARIRLVVEGMMMDEFNALLFAGYRRDVATENRWRHVVMDTRLQPGCRAHLELIDDGPGRLEVDAIWMSDHAGRVPAIIGRPGWIGGARAGDRSRFARAIAKTASGRIGNPSDGVALRDSLIEAGLWGIDLASADAARDRRLQDIEARREIAGALPNPRRVLAANEGSGVDQPIYIRGSHRTPGGIATRSFIDSIADDQPSPPLHGSGRIQLADAILDLSNPLTARVMANRVWHHLFGRGLVTSTDDFGGLGAMPSHPALLDHLATQFQSDWSIKNLIRSIVTSSVYRRSSMATPETAARMLTVDPQNELLAIAPIRRLQAEAIRDALLAVSGRLVDQVGGPPVATHLTPFMTGRGRPGGSGPMDGGGRRSLYLEVRRNFPDPMLTAFDQPPPSTTVGTRNISNVPAQSLVFLNDPLVHELAGIWAARILDDSSLVDDRSRADQMWRAAFTVEPSEEDLDDIVAFVAAGDDQRERWADVGHALFNTKAFIYLD
jgi:cytochrome c553